MPLPPRILVVDDNRDAAKLMLFVLGRHGFRLAYAYCGLTGLVLARMTKPDLILLNYLMPQMHGIAVLRELRADPMTAGIKVIMTSGYSRIAELASEAGAQDSILYPFLIREMEMKVNRVLGSSWK